MLGSQINLSCQSKNASEHLFHISTLRAHKSLDVSKKRSLSNFIAFWDISANLAHDLDDEPAVIFLISIAQTS